MTWFESKLLVLRGTIQRHSSRVEEWQHPVSQRNYVWASQDFKYLGSMGYNGECGEGWCKQLGNGGRNVSGVASWEKEKTINKNDRRGLQKGGKTSNDVVVWV